MRGKLLQTKIKCRWKVLMFVFAFVSVICFFDTKVKAQTNDFTGWTAISSAEELQKLSYSDASSRYYLTNDIDLSRYGYWNTIEEFRGTFDGNGHCIKNLKSTTGGLFSKLYPGATIQNLRMENVDIRTNTGAGAIAAKSVLDDAYEDWGYIESLVSAGQYHINSNGERQIDVTPVVIRRCSVSGRIFVDGDFNDTVGGIIGATSGAGWYSGFGKADETVSEDTESYLATSDVSIEECANFAVIYAEGETYAAGGIIGDQQWGNVSNCINYGEVSASEKLSGVGGIAGFISGKISNSYSAVEISSNEEKWGSVIGYAWEDTVINDCYYYGGNEGLIESLFKPKKISYYNRSKQSSYSGWDFNRVWFVDAGINDGYPVLQWMLPYLKIEAPSANMKSGSYSKAFSVQLTSHLSNATIYYTTDGSKPSTGSKKYTGAIAIKKTTTLKAIAVSVNGSVSPVATYKYTFACIEPTSNYKNGKSFDGPAKIKLSTKEKGAKIYYTTNGKKPTKKSKRYKGAITLYKNTQIRAVVIKSGKADSKVVNWNYYVRAKTPQADRPTGVYDSAVRVKLSCKTKGAKIYYTTNGKTPTAKSKRYKGTLTIKKNTELKIIAIHKNVKSDVMTYYYGVKAEMPVSNKTEGDYKGKVVVRLTSKTKNATIYYTTDGSEPSIYSTRYTGPITLNQSTNIRAIAVKNGMENSDVFTVYYYIYQ